MVCICRLSYISRGFAGASSTLGKDLSASKDVLRVELLTVASVLGAAIIMNSAIPPAAA